MADEVLHHSLTHEEKEELARAVALDLARGVSREKIASRLVRRDWFSNLLLADLFVQQVVKDIDDLEDYILAKENEERQSYRLTAVGAAWTLISIVLAVLRFFDDGLSPGWAAASVASIVLGICILVAGQMAATSDVLTADRQVRCPHCRTDLDLSVGDSVRGYYDCPECGRRVMC